MPQISLILFCKPNLKIRKAERGKLKGESSKGKAERGKLKGDTRHFEHLSSVSIGG